MPKNKKIRIAQRIAALFLCAAIAFGLLAAQETENVSHPPVQYHTRERVPLAAQTVSETQEDDAASVYITRTGEKYHRAGCRYLSKSKISISQDGAQSEGYAPCLRCFPA